jgi:enoyl-CoA hydratase/carnithine racemase
MAYTNFTLETDADGIALITWDMPGKSMNVIDLTVMDELDALIDAVTGDDAITGAVITSGKETFSGGADLTMLEGLLRDFHAQREKDPEAAAKLLFDGSRRLSQIFRKLETCGKPFVAAINGTCMGGATELALACHARIAAEGDAFKMALPEVKVGLFPGAGGTQRVMRMADAQQGLQFLLQGRTLNADKAKGLKLVDAIAPAKKLVAGAQDAESGCRPGETLGQEGLQAAERADLFAGGLPVLAGGQCDLPPRNARQLSGRARHHAVGLRRPANADGPGADGGKPLFRACAADAGSRQHDPLAVRLDAGAEQGRAPAGGHQAEQVRRSASSARASWAQASPMSPPSAGIRRGADRSRPGRRRQGQGLFRRADLQGDAEGPDHKGSTRRSCCR